MRDENVRLMQRDAGWSTMKSSKVTLLEYVLIQDFDSVETECALNKKSFHNIVSLSARDSCAPNLGDIWLLSVFN